MNAEGYIPPLRYRLLTRFYDPLVRWTTRESACKNALMRTLFLAVQILDGFETTRDSVSGA